MLTFLVYFVLITKYLRLSPLRVVALVVTVGLTWIIVSILLGGPGSGFPRIQQLFNSECGTLPCFTAEVPRVASWSWDRCPGWDAGNLGSPPPPPQGASGCPQPTSWDQMHPFPYQSGASARKATHCEQR
uniref:Uncharacterized protein n=1 Tax=Spermophilus dauricus TaxID=99837 RepID=A0A8C9QCY3_SPEDA